MTNCFDTDWADSAKQAQLRKMPMRLRFAVMLGSEGELNEVAPRRYLGPDGTVHYFAGMCIKRAVSAGVLEEVNPGCFRLGRDAAAVGQRA